MNDSGFQIYYLIAPNDVNGNPRRGWFIVYPSGLHRWVGEGFDMNMSLREELTGLPMARSGLLYGAWCALSEKIAAQARTGRYNITVGTYKSLRSCAAQNRLPRLSEGNYKGDWIWA